jgi:hypothetical protein
MAAGQPREGDEAVPTSNLQTPRSTEFAVTIESTHTATCAAHPKGLAVQGTCDLACRKLSTAWVDLKECRIR